MTSTGYRVQVNGSALLPRLVVYSGPGCTGTLAIPTQDQAENGVGVGPGELFRNGGSTFFVPLDSVLFPSFPTQSFRNVNGNCTSFSGTEPVYPAQANNPAVTGITISNPSTLQVEYFR